MPSQSTFGFIASPAAATAFLKRFGYLPTEVSAFEAVVASTDAPEPGIAAALRQYQAFNGLPVTGELDAATAAQMSQPRCGFPDVLTISEFSLHGNKWPTAKLTYRFENFSPDLTATEIRNAMTAAMTLWSAVTPLRFTETSGAADLRIRFASGDHGDGSSFDGAGKVLAHAFFPPPTMGDLAGDMHFDEEELWHEALPIPAGRFDLITVAAHELGHSLGLAHSNVSNALMFPSYTGAHRFLAPDDIAGIQALYGPNT